MNKYRSRIHMLLLYPENEQHRNALNYIEKNFDYVGVLHDKDKWTEEDEKKNPEHKVGTFKKEHWHIILRFNQAVWNTAICKQLGIETNYIEQINKFDNALQYLIHYNDDEKTSYSVDDLFGNLKSKVQESINKTEKSEGEKVSELITFIKDYDGYLSVTDFASYCATNGYWSEFRRSGAIFCKIIDEHNNYFSNQYNSGEETNES